MEKRIIVAGAGHGGLVAARYLAEAGYDVTVYEKKSFDELGYSQEDSVHLDGFELSGVPVPEQYKTKRTPIAFCVLGADLPPLVQADSENTYNVEIDRHALYEHLYTPCVEAGVCFEWNVTIEAPVMLGSRVVGIKTDKGVFYADLVIDAAGLYSPLRTKMPEFTHITNMPGMFDVLSTYRVCFSKNKDVPSPELKYKVSLIPDNGEFCGLLWVIDKDEYMDIFIGAFGELTQENIDYYTSVLKEENPSIGDTVIKGGSGIVDIPVRAPLSVMVADGYAAVGDSAFMTIPIKGSGIGYSMRAGKMLAETVIKDTDGLFDRENLWDYQVSFYKEIGSGAGLLAIIKNILPMITRDDIIYAFGEEILSSRDMELFGSEAGMMKILRSIKPSVFYDKAKKVAGRPEFRKMILTVGKNIAKYKVLEQHFKEKYDFSAVVKWQEVSDKFFESIKRSE